MSVYTVTEIIGASPIGWEEAAKAALAVAAGSLRDLRIAEVVEQDITLGTDGKVNWRSTPGTPYVPTPLVLGDRLYFLVGPTLQLTSAAFAPGSQLIAVTSFDGSVRPQASSRAVRRPLATS